MAPARDTQARGHLDALTGVRGLAAWLVVFYHIRSTLAGLMPQAVIDGLSRGYLAVDLFFMLSGFVLWYNYGAKLPGGGVPAALGFYRRRIARIWPLHAVILAAFVAYALALAATGRPAPGMPFAQLPLHVLLIQNWGFTTALAWNDPSWSISTELAAYLLFPALVAVLGRGRLSPGAIVALGLAVLATIAAVFALAGQASLGGDIPRTGLARCLLEFTLGMLACMVWQGTGGRPGAPWLLGWAGLALALAGFAGGLAEPVFVPAAFVLLLLGMASGRGRVVGFLSARPLVYLGEISYSTYLAHFLLFKAWKLAFVDASLRLSWFSLLAFVAVLLAVSVVLYHGVEKPGQRMFNRIPPGRARGRLLRAAP